MLNAVIFNVAGVILDIVSNNTVPYVNNLIQDLYNHGIKLAAVSPYPLDSTVNVLETLKLKIYFDAIISEAHVENTKPAPDSFLEALKQLKAGPNECIVIDYLTEGIEAAAAAGITSVGYVNPYAARQNLSKAAFLVEGFEEIDAQFLHNVYQYVHGKPADIIVTQRIVLRELTTEDIKALYTICLDPEVKKYAPMMEDLAMEMVLHEAYIRNVYHFYGYGLWGVFLREDSRLIGRCGIEQKIVDNTEEFELGYLIDRSYWGLGYAKEAVEAVIKYTKDFLQVSRILAVIEKDNVRSIRLAELTGFILNGETLRNGRSCYKYYLS